ncbi:MAG: hypothetical protein ICV66_09215 [Chitinophagaceae bacterium]|nr:hypothetical protein [Chitinophagaceae bacterium]
MKKILIVLSLFLLYACNNNPGESGVVNDGVKAVDSNGAFTDTAKMAPNPAIDTSKGEDRVDIEKRDSAKR